VSTHEDVVPRLSAATRERAARAMDGEWGRALVDLPVSFDAMADWDTLSPNRRYARGVATIAEHAPIRILPDQPIVGAATLRDATWHCLPVRRGGKLPYYAVSHLTPDFEAILKLGYAGLRKQVQERLSRGGLEAAGRDFLESMLLCIEAAGVWHRRNLDLLAELIAGASGDARRNYKAVRATLLRVPEHPATTFREAVQSFWMAVCFQRCCGNWPGIGRVDQILGPYLEADLKSGRTTLDEAREMIAAFWINSCDWLGVGNDGRGEGQFFQNVVLAGIDADGREVANDVTHLVLDVASELHIAELPIAVRIGERTPDALLRRVARLIRAGNGTIAVYNEDLVIRALTRFGYPEREARRFANDGCWEVQIPGETCFGYEPFDLLLLLQEVLGIGSDGPIPEYPTFDALFAAFSARLQAFMEGFHSRADHYALNWQPTPLISLFVKDCIERARGYLDRGARYTVFAPHAGGVPDVGNSLFAIKRVVYDERRTSFADLVAGLRRNWDGSENLRQHLLGSLPRYGNDDSEADAMTKRVLDTFLGYAEAVHERDGVLRPAGVSTFERAVVWRKHRKATADGHREGDILATNFSPTPGTDAKGPTAVLRSVGAMDLERVPNGTAVELKLDPASVAGESGLDALVGLLRGFVAVGGMFLQMDVVSSETLREAQRHPEQYRNLAVRISGWSARFATLSAEYQDLLIQRTQQRT
jgi:formate C-acetyltransferase